METSIASFYKDTGILSGLFKEKRSMSVPLTLNA